MKNDQAASNSFSRFLSLSFANNLVLSISLVRCHLIKHKLIPKRSPGCKWRQVCTRAWTALTEAGRASGRLAKWRRRTEVGPIR